jgi:WD40-like Beta Propeller Repeat
MGKRRAPAARRLLPLALAAAAAWALPARAQFIPYYGKNKIQYESFDWRVYKSPHFEVYYYPEFEQHLGRLVSYAESAYQKISSELKHEINKPIPLIYYKTHSEFEQTNLFPAFVPEGVAAFTEPSRDRMVIPIDEPSDRLNGLITHELTHVFEFDLIPRGLLQRNVPLWIDEGLADYMRGLWDPLDLMMVRDAAVADQVPKLSRAEFEPLSGRLVYNLGHACFEFIADRYGKEGLRQFIYTWRKNLVSGSLDEIYQQAFRIKAEEFDEAFDKWLKQRFKPFRDKQRPSDYGKTLSPNEEKTPFTQVFGAAASPSGELVAALTANRSDQDLDVVLLSAKDGTVVKNLTGGFSNAFRDIGFAEDFTASRVIDFDPSGDRVAFVARVEKRRSLILVSTLTGGVQKRIDLALDQPLGPCLLPDGTHALVSGLKDGVSDIFLVDLETGALKNLTQDPYQDTNARISPDGKLVAYTRRISGNTKIYAFPLADPTRRTQLTFGPHDDAAPIFSADSGTLYYSSNEDGDIYNLRSLDLKTGVVKQWTDVLGGNLVPFPLKTERGERLGFISYFKGEFILKSLDLTEPMKEVDQDVRPAVEQLVDFEPDLTHQVVTQNKRRKHTYEGLYLEGRPPLNVGVTSSGDFFGGSQIALTDVMGDQNFTFTAYSVREFRTYNGSYLNLAHRFQYGLQGFDTTQFFYSSPYQLEPGFSRQGTLATQRVSGASLVGQYPLDIFRRLELSAGVFRLKEQIEDPVAEQLLRDQAAAAGIPYLLNDGWLLPVSAHLVQETTRFREFGPLSGSTFSVGAEYSPSVGSRGLGRTTIDGDLRKYLRVGSTSLVLAGRARAFKSFGNNPGIFYFGGNMELRGYPYLSFSGSQGFFANTELRFPIIDVAKTPLGLIGPVRGTLYAGVGGAHYPGEAYKFSSSEPGISYVKYDPNDASTLLGEPVSGLHLVDGRASYGIGIQLFFLGYPLHFDWSKLTDFKVHSKTQFSFWIGYDF